MNSLQDEEIEECLKRQPERWDLWLGAIDADLTHNFLDQGRNLWERSHKYTSVPRDIFSLAWELNNKKAVMWYQNLQKSYLASFQFVEYVITEKYRRNFDTVDFTVRAKVEIKKGTTITGLDGYFAPYYEGRPKFSMFGASDNVDEERIMLGPASFVNHSCNPNAKYECGGQSRNQTVLRVQAIKNIPKGEDILVRYNDEYFGPNNEDCECTPCSTERSDANRRFMEGPSQEELRSPTASEWKRHQARLAEQDLAEGSFPGPSTQQLPGPSTPLIPGPSTQQIPGPSTQQIPQPKSPKNPKKNSPKKNSPNNNPKQKKYEKKIKLDKTIQCLICANSANRMDKHLIQKHPEITDAERHLLMQFIRFSNAHQNTKIMYCPVHMKRFAVKDKASHARYDKCNLEQAYVLENPMSRTSLPTELRLKLKNSTLPREEHTRMAQDFINHHYHAKGVGDEDVRGKGAIVNMLAILYNNTNGLTEPKNIMKSFERLEVTKKWKPSSVVVYINYFSQFLDYCALYENRKLSKHFKLDLMKAAIKEVRKKYGKEMSKYTRECSRKLFAKVPTMKQLKKRIAEVKKKLNDDLTETDEKKKLSFTHRKVLNFFLIQARMCCRSGVVLRLSWDCYETQLRHGTMVETNNHKTGRCFVLILHLSSKPIK